MVMAGSLMLLLRFSNTQVLRHFMFSRPIGNLKAINERTADGGAGHAGGIAHFARRSERIGASRR
jgi:hypothetical protein